MFTCKHHWETTVNKLVDSFWERAKLTGAKTIPPNAMESTSIVIMVCKKCGKVDKTITKC